MNQFNTGIRKYRQALQIIRREKLAWYFLFPLVFFILAFFFSFSLASSLTDTIMLQINSYFDSDSFFYTIISGSLNIIIKIIIALLFAYIGGFLVLILLSPVFAYLSELVEKRLTGNDYPFEFSQFVSDIFRGIGLALRNFFIEIGLIILVWIATLIFGLIPGIGFLFAIAGQIFLFFVSAYFYGFSFMDYSCERHKMNRAQSVLFMRKNKWAVIGIGFPFAALLFFSFLGISVIISGFLAIVSVVAATVYMLELMEKLPKNYSQKSGF